MRKKRKQKKDGLLQYLDFKKMQTEINGYGYHYSLKKYLLTMVLAFLAVAIICNFFRLQSTYIVVLLVIFGICFPVLVVTQFRFLYEQKRFRETIDYLEQMIYSFKKKPKILVSLQDVLTLSSGKMKEVIQEAIDYINSGMDYKLALKPIEDQYGCDRMGVLHDFLVKVEKQGGEYQETLNVILSDIQSWTERTYSFQKDRAYVKNTIVISIVVSAFVSGITVLLLSRNSDMKDILNYRAYQIGTFMLLSVLMLLYLLVQKIMTGSWLQVKQEENIKQIDRDWKNLQGNHNYKGKIISSLIAAVICSPVLILGFVQQQKFLIIFGIIVECIVLTVPKRGKGTSKSRLTKECENRFPGWLRGLALSLQTDNVYNALVNSLDTAPYVFKAQIQRLVDEIGKDPTSILPYQHFLEELEVPEIHSIIKMLYSLTNLGNEDSVLQINALIERNNLLMDKSERLREEDSVKLTKQMTWIPMLSATAKIFLDMGLLIMYLFSMMGALTT